MPPSRRALRARRADPESQPRPAIIHFLAGEADLTVGVDAHHAIPGTWVRMQADTKHSVVARTAVVMALYLLPRLER